MYNKDLFSFLRNHSFVKVYEYLKDNRVDIMRDHKINKSGVYILYNKTNTHYYVGSSINILGRMKNYLNIKNLELNQNKNMPVVKLKYGHNNFALIIIKYLLE
jgi:GIY-YIG catalytic domain